MYGIEAINAQNGWAISIVGISIVFAGLVMLSIVISQLHKVLDLWENPSKIKKIFSSDAADDPMPEAKVKEENSLTAGQKESFRQFSLLARTMGDHFSLPGLLQMAGISGLDDPYGTVDTLVDMAIIIPDHDGFFLWDNEAFETATAQ